MARLEKCLPIKESMTRVYVVTVTTLLLVFTCKHRFNQVVFVIKLKAGRHRLRPLGDPAACHHCSALRLSLPELLSACSPV